MFLQLERRHSGRLNKLVIAVRGSRPKCIWNGVMFNLLCGFCLIVLIAKLTLSSNVKPSAMFALVNDLIVRIVLSTWPVPVCTFGVHRMRFIFSWLQNLNSLLLKQLPLSVRILRGVPLSEQYFVIKFKTVRESVFLQTWAVRLRLKYIHRRESLILLDQRSPIGFLGSVQIEFPDCLFSVDDNYIVKFLPAAGAIFGFFSYFPVQAGPPECCD